VWYLWFFLIFVGHNNFVMLNTEKGR